MKIGFFITPKYIFNRETHKYTTSPISTLKGLEEFRKKNGFDYMEYFVEHEQYLDEIKKGNIQSIKVCHLSLIDAPTHMPENRDAIIHFYELQIQKYKKWFNEFDLHLPKQWIFIPDKVFLQDMEYFAKAFDKLAEKYNVKLNLENETACAKDCLVFFNKGKKTKMCFDIGHAYMRYITKGADEDPLKFFDKVFKYVDNIHIMDSRRSMDYHHDHMAVGEGNLALNKFLSLIKSKGYKGKLTIECLTLKDVERSKKYIDKFFK
jgi:hypothetical protein